MTTVRNSQQVGYAVSGNNATPGMRSSQIVGYATQSNPHAVGMFASQIIGYALMANGARFQQLGTPITLGCWSPCNNHMFRG